MAGAGMKLGAGLATAAGAMAAFGAIRFIKDSSQKAAEFEMMTGAFETLLGSSTKAAERIKKLQEFSVKTPYTPKELVEASKLLQGLGGETLAIGEGLEMIGDAASGADKPLALIAENVGRLFSGMRAGKGFTEQLNQLRLFTSISETGFTQLSKLNDEIVAGDRDALSQAEAFKALKGAMTVWTGEMGKASLRHGGMVSTMKGNMDLLQISFGDGINKGLAKGVALMNEKIPTWMDSAKRLGDAIGQGIGQAFMGNTKLLELQIAFVFTKLGEIAAAVFLRAMTTIVGDGLAVWMQESEFLHGRKDGPVGGPGVFDWMAPLGKSLQKHGRAEDFQMSQFLDYSKGAFGSETLAREMLEVQKQIRDKQLNDAPGWLKAWGGPMLEDHWIDLKYK